MFRIMLVLQPYKFMTQKNMFRCSKAQCFLLQYNSMNIIKLDPSEPYFRSLAAVWFVLILLFCKLITADIKLLFLYHCGASSNIIFYINNDKLCMLGSAIDPLTGGVEIIAPPDRLNGDVKLLTPGVRVRLPTLTHATCGYWYLLNLLWWSG